MGRFIVAVSLFLSPVAFAALYPLSKIPVQIKPASFESLRPAALQIPAVDEQFGCSATVISKQGHVLTGLHCVPQCVKQLSNSSIKSFKYLAPDKQQILAGKANCRLPFVQEGKKMGNFPVQVVAAGAGYVIETDPGDLAKELDKRPDRRAIFSQLIQAGVGIPGDFAVLYVPGLANRPCAKTVGRAPVVNEDIWNIGYPDSRGDRATFSYGKVTYAATSKVDYTVTSGKQGASLITRRNGMFIGGIEAHEGSSGSGVFSYKGDLVGLLNAAQIGERSFASSIDYLIQYASANYGVAKIAQAFNCQ